MMRVVTWNRNGLNIQLRTQKQETQSYSSAYYHVFSYSVIQIRNQQNTPFIWRETLLLVLDPSHTCCGPAMEFQSSIMISVQNVNSTYIAIQQLYI
jgi:hypothetical protein